MEYRVTWTIDILAGSPKQAAETALRIQRDQESLATIFEVVQWSPVQGRPVGKPYRVDLQKEKS